MSKALAAKNVIIGVRKLKTVMGHQVVVFITILPFMFSCLLSPFIAESW